MTSTTRSSTTSRIARALHRPVRLLNTLLLIAVTLGGAAYLVPGLFGYERYVITGGSMSGTFEKGSIAFEKPTPVTDLRVGDVITYLPPPDSGVTTLVTHRITKIRTVEQTDPTGDPTGHTTTLYRTQGDANPDPDPWTFSLTADTQPVVDFTVPYLGHAFIALADPDIRKAVIGIPALVIAAMALRDLVRALRPSREADESAAPQARSQTPVSVPAPRPGEAADRAPSRGTGAAHRRA